MGYPSFNDPCTIKYADISIFCSLSAKAEITLFLQAEQIVAKLMINMAAADKRLAEEQNRQAMVITLR